MRLSIVAAGVAFQLCGCGSESAELTCAPAIIGKRQHALYGGVTTPGVIALPSEEQLAIVAVAPALGSPGFFCSGVVIAEDWILTAAHCDQGGPLIVGVGPNAAEPQFELIADEVFAHPALDALLLHVPASGLAEAGIRPIRISETTLDDRFRGAIVQLAGFGRQAEGTARRLAFLAAEVSDVQAHALTLQGNGQSGACIGDSGGPLLVRGEDGRARVAGILSTGDASCTGLDTYTRLDILAPWLVQQIGPALSARPSSSNCFDTSHVGLCLAGTAMWCEGEHVVTRACAKGTVCGWDVDAEGYRCVQANEDPCDGLANTGHCDGEIARWCEQGTPMALDCGQCSSACIRRTDTGRASCSRNP